MAYNLGNIKVGVQQVGLRDARTNFQRFATQMRETAAVADRVARQIGGGMIRMDGRAARTAGSVERSNLRMARSMERLRGSTVNAFSRMRTVVGGFATFYVGLNLSRNILTTAATFQRLETSLLAFTGNLKDFNKAYGNIMHLTRNSPAEIDQVTKAYQRFMQVGIDVVEANEMMAKSVDIASASMLPAGEALERVTKFLQRALSGFAELQDAELLETAGFPFTKFLMDMYGKGRHGMKDIIKQEGGGERMARDFLDYFGDQYDGLALKMMDKLTGTYARLRNQMQLSFKEIGIGMTEPLRDAGSVIEDLLINHKDDLRQLGFYLGDIIKDLAEMFRILTINPEKTVNTIKGLFKVLGLWAAAGVGGSILRTLGGMFDMMRGIAGLFRGGGIMATGGLGMMFANPAGLAIGLGATAIAVGNVARSMGELKTEYQAITGEKLGTASAGKYMLEDMFDRIGQSIRDANSSFDDFMTNIIENIGKIPEKLGLTGGDAPSVQRAKSLGGSGGGPGGAGRVGNLPVVIRDDSPAPVAVTTQGPGLGQSGPHISGGAPAGAAPVPVVVRNPEDVLGMKPALEAFVRRQDEAALGIRERYRQGVRGPVRAGYGVGPQGRRGHRRFTQFGGTNLMTRSGLRGSRFGSPMDQGIAPSEEVAPRLWHEGSPMQGPPVADTPEAFMGAGVESAFRQMFDNLAGIAEGGSRSIIENLKDVFDEMSRTFGKEAWQRAVIDPIKDVMDGFFGAAMDSLFGAGGGGGSASRRAGRQAFGGLRDILGFEGGGFTGRGPRSGGLDGRGGKLAMLHPNEMVTDLHRGGGVAVRSRIEIVNLPGQDSRVLSQGRDADGFEKIVVAIERRVAENIYEDGEIGSALVNKYGLQEGGVRETG